MDFGRYQRVAEFVKDNLSEGNFLHTYRVFNYALQILAAEEEANPEVVILSALLHDIGRMKKKGEKSEASANHAQRGNRKSYALLMGLGYAEELANQVSECVLCHSRNGKDEPQTIEAKILFDADKLDMTGAVGIARAIQYAGSGHKPLYLADENGAPMKGKKKESPSILQDYKQDLEKITEVFYTDKARRIAAKRQKTMDGYFAQLYKEVRKNHENGTKLAETYCV